MKRLALAAFHRRAAKCVLLFLASDLGECRYRAAKGVACIV
jgi:hypothetical protein